jgi:hypothetical protein
MTQVRFTDVGFPTNIVISNKLDQWRTKVFTADDVVFGEVSSQVIPVVARMFPAWEFKVTQVHTEGPFVERKVFPTWVAVSEKGVERGRIQIRAPWRSYDEDLVFENPRIYNAMQRVGRKVTTKPKVAVQIVKQYFTDPPITETIAIVSKQIRSTANVQKASFKSSRDLEYMRLVGMIQPYIDEHLVEIAKQVAEVNANFNVPEYLEYVEDTKISASVADAPSNSALTVMLRGDKYVLHRSNMSVFALSSEYLPEPVRRAIGLLKLVEDGQFVRDVGYRHKADQFLVIYAGSFDEETTCKTSS